MIDYKNIDEIPGIYIFKNLITNKYYVGESLNLKRRIKEHLRHKSQIIGKSINKYGKDNFNLHVEYFPNEDKETLLDIEEEIIKQLKCFTPHGYNICKRGQDSSGRKASPEARVNMSKGQMGNKNACGPKTKEHVEKIAMSRRGKKLSDEARRNISMGHKGLRLGMKLSDETKAKLSEASLGRYHVTCVSEDQVKEICSKYIPKKYPASRLASEYGVSTNTIYNCLKVYSKR